MTDVFGVADAKRRFSELVDRVGRGERFVVSRHGRPVVALVPPNEGEAPIERPRGLLSILGALSDVDEWDEIVSSIYRERRRAAERPGPVLE